MFHTILLVILSFENISNEELNQLLDLVQQNVQEAEHYVMPSTNSEMTTTTSEKIIGTLLN